MSILSKPLKRKSAGTMARLKNFDRRYGVDNADKIVPNINRERERKV